MKIEQSDQLIEKQSNDGSFRRCHQNHSLVIIFANPTGDESQYQDVRPSFGEKYRQPVQERALPAPA